MSHRFAWSGVERHLASSLRNGKRLEFIAHELFPVDSEHAMVMILCMVSECVGVGKGAAE